MSSQWLADRLASLSSRDSAADNSEAGKYLGTWKQVAVIVDGQEIQVGKSTLMEVAKDGYKVTAEGRLFQRGTSKIVGEGDPRRSDIIVSEGAGAGSTIPQITKVTGDVLIGCQSKSGAARPTEFTSERGSGHTLSVWIRVK